MGAAINTIRNAGLLPSIASARINRRRIFFNDSQFAYTTQWRPNATFFNDPRVQLGFMQAPRAIGVGAVNNACGSFGGLNGGVVRTVMTPGAAYPSPNNAYTCAVPAGLLYDAFGSEVANFTLLNDQQRFYSGAAGGEWILGQQVRFGTIAVRLPTGYNMTSSGISLWTAEADLSPNQEQTPAFAVDFLSDGITKPHNSTVVLERPTTVTAALSSGTYGVSYMGLWSVFGVEIGTTTQCWTRYVRRCDASGVWTPNKFGILHFGDGGYRMEDFMTAGYDTGSGIRKFTDAGAQPIIDWFNPEEIVIPLGQNGFISEGDFYTKTSSVIARAHALAPNAIIHLMSLWDATSNVATYDFTTERVRYDSIHAVYEQCAAENPSYVMHSPLGREVRSRLGNPSNAGGNWLSTHLADGIHLSQTGATDATTALPRFWLDMLEKGTGINRKVFLMGSGLASAMGMDD